MSSFVKIKILLVLLISIALGYATHIFLIGFQTEVEVVVASRDIIEGEVIRDEMLRTIKVRKKEKDDLAPRSVSSTAELEGKMSLLPIPEGKPIDMKSDVVTIDTERLTAENGAAINEDGISASYTLNADERLIGIQLSDASTAHLTRGDLVDILGVYDKEESGFTTLVLAQSKKVFDIKKLGEEGESEGANVVLKVTPEEGAAITTLENIGKIQLMLSSKRGKQVNKTYYDLTQITADIQ